MSITEHHANIVPWLILKQDHGIEVDYVGVREDYSLDFDDLEKKLDDTVKIVSLTHVSNTTGQIFDLERVDEMLDEVYGPHPTSPYQGEEQTVASSLLTKEGIEEGHRPLFIVDASQSVPHFQVDVEKI